MTEDDMFGPFWEGVGHALGVYLNGDVEDVLLYLECEPGSFGGFMYRGHPHDVEQVDPSHEIFLAVFEHWKALDSDTAWSAMHYSILNGKFRVTFDYPSARLAPGDSRIEGFDDRLMRAVASLYGNKPIRPAAD